MASQLKVNSGGHGEFLRKPTTKNFAKPPHRGKFSTNTLHEPGARQPNGYFLVPESSRDDTVSKHVAPDWESLLMPIAQDTNMKRIKLFINRGGDPKGESSESSTIKTCVASPASNGGNVSHYFSHYFSHCFSQYNYLMLSLDAPACTKIETKSSQQYKVCCCWHDTRSRYKARPQSPSRQVNRFEAHRYSYYNLQTLFLVRYRRFNGHQDNRPSAIKHRRAESRFTFDGSGWS